MKAMILAAGGGTRLYPLTFTLPKPMAPVCNRPVMEHIINQLKLHGFDELIVNLHNLPQHIQGHFRDGYQLGVQITYSHEAQPLGTAGGVKNVEDQFERTFMVIGGDDLHNVDLSAMLQFHREHKALATIGLSYEEDVHQYGVVVTDDSGRIQEFQEKPSNDLAKSHWVNNGIYLFEPDIFKLIPDGVFYDFGSQLFPLLKDQGKPFYGYRCKGYWKDIGNLVEYRNAHLDCLNGQVKVSFPGMELKPGVWVDEGVEIHEDAIIEPPVIIGRNCRIGPGVHLKGPVAMGKYNVLDENVKLEGTVMWNYNQLKERVVLRDCMMGSDCILSEDMVFEETVLGSGMKHVFEDYFRRKKMVPKVM